jgi:hypothetical protein
MALGEALMEEMTYRRLPKHLSGALVHKFPSLLEYKSPTTLEMPEVVTYLVEQPDGAGPMGAKEVGQGPLLPIMPALANAVHDAVGIRVDEVPITPEKVLRAMGESVSRRFGPAAFPRIDWPEPLRVAPPWEGGDGTAANEKPRRRQAGAIVAPEVVLGGGSPHPSTPEARRGGAGSPSETHWPEVLR